MKKLFILIPTTLGLLISCRNYTAQSPQANAPTAPSAQEYDPFPAEPNAPSYPEQNTAPRPYPSYPEVQPTAPVSNAGAGQHVVQKGETLWRISKKYNTTVADLQSLNGIAGTTIYQGQTILVR